VLSSIYGYVVCWCVLSHQLCLTKVPGLVFVCFVYLSTYILSPPLQQGRAEALRLALYIGDIPFEDERLTPTEFVTLKPTLPYGSLPILTVDDTVYAQSSAILRYCGKLAGLYSDDPIEAIRIDEIIDTVIDFVSGLEQVANSRDDDDEATYEANTRLHLDQSIPRYFGGLEKRLNEFGDGPWAVGDSVTIADLAIYVCLLNIQAGAFDHVPVDLLQPYGRVLTCFAAVMAHTSVAEWNAKIEAKMDELRKSKEVAEQEAEQELQNSN